MKYSYALLGFGLAVNALIAPLPSPTHNIAHDLGYGFELLPTTAPMMPRDLLKRQGSNSGSLVGYVAPDNTCGYVSGVQSSIKTCGTTESCAAVIQSGVASMGCCDTKAGTCQFLGNCVDSMAYYSSSDCGAACKADVNTLKCTAASKPYCYSYLVPALTMGFFSCASTTSASFAPFATTYSGQASVSWRKVYDNDASSKDPIAAATSRLSGGNAFSSLSSSPASATTPAASASESTKSTPIGAIVGGVVGGLAVIGVAIAGILFFCIKKRSQANKTATPVVTNGSNVVSPGMQQQQQVASPYQGYDVNNQQGFAQNGYFPQQHSDPNYNAYFGGAAAVGHLSHHSDQKLGAYDTVSSLPVSPAPQYNPAMSPPLQQQGMNGPSPALSNIDVAQPPAGYHEAPGAPVGVIPSPHQGAVQLATNTTPTHINAPAELGSDSAVASRTVPTTQTAGSAPPVELGTNPAAPKRDAQGNQVFEMGG